MKRRELISLAAGAAGGLAAAPMVARAAVAIPDQPLYRAGEHYHLIENPIEPVNPQGVEVVEVFSYMCIHCFNFDQPVEAWRRKLPEGATFRRSPAVFSPSWRVMAQGYYTADVLGIIDQVHSAMFNALHIDRINIANQRALGNLFKQIAGVETAAFNQAWDSFGVLAAVEQADSSSRAWGINAVPQLVVNGRYRLDGRLVDGSNMAMLQIAEWLVQRELAEISLR